jgi:hypothetical protein
MIEELKALGVLDLVNLEKPREISKHDPKVIKFMEEAYLRRYKTYTNLGLTITKKTDPMRFIHRLMQRIGLGLTCTRTEKVGDSKTRYYSLNKGLLNDPDRLAILKSLDRKFLGEVPTEEKMAETGIPENYSSGTAQPKKLSINESAVPVEKDLKKEEEVEETLDYYEVIASIDLEMERLGWSKERGIGYILGKYGVTSRFNLDDVQLISFWNYLRKEAICR